MEKAILLIIPTTKTEAGDFRKKKKKKGYQRRLQDKNKKSENMGFSEELSFESKMKERIKIW